MNAAGAIVLVFVFVLLLELVLVHGALSSAEGVELVLSA